MSNGNFDWRKKNQNRMKDWTGMSSSGGSLSQEEIDSLMQGAYHGDWQKPKTIEQLEKSLLSRSIKETPYGLFEKDVSIISFFADKNSESILQDIRNKNAENKSGNIKIPDSNIELINYSVCPKCKTVHSYDELITYYNSPIPKVFYDRKTQLRKDTSVSCFNCGNYFLPALVIVDGTPKNEYQFLCRMQTIDAIEDYLFTSLKLSVLTKNSINMVKNKDEIYVINDVDIRNLKLKPTLITNMIQYTPFDLILNFVNSSNIQTKDPLFGNRKLKYLPH